MPDVAPVVSNGCCVLQASNPVPWYAPGTLRRVTCIALFSLLAIACGSDPAPKTTAAPGRRVPIEVKKTGYVPNTLDAAAGEQLVLVFTRTEDTHCGKYIAIRGQEGQTELPLNEPVEVPVTMPKTGELVFQCGMDMMHGIIAVNE